MSPRTLKTLIAAIIFFMAQSNLGAEKLETATFAGGCFWCIEAAFEGTKGVQKAISGYIGGDGSNPTYEDYAQKGFVEAVQITYDPNLISYNELLDIFWKQIDPTDTGGQFADRGPQYHTVIFYHNQTQKEEAQASKIKLENSGIFKKPIVTEIIPAAEFYRTEEYHQNYWNTSATQYKIYRSMSGRSQFLEKIWGKQPSKACPLEKNNPEINKPSTSKENLKEKLTPLQFQVTQENATEPAFNNPYWDNKEEGLYVDIVSGEPLFSSKDKFDSQTGWPSFTKPLEPGNIIKKEDKTILIKRTEVKSRNAGSHLGHVFEDGPKPTGLRYCINSAALRFIPKEDLEKEGYGKYIKIFEEP